MEDELRKEYEEIKEFYEKCYDISFLRDNVVQSHVVDKTELANFVEIAKGNLSWSEFAKKCGYSVPTLYRIKNGDLTKPLKLEMIYSFWINNECQKTYNMGKYNYNEEWETGYFLLNNLVYSNGMINKNAPVVKEDFLRFSKYRGLETNIKNTVLLYILKRWNKVDLLNDEARMKVPELAKLSKWSFRDAVKLDIKEPSYCVFTYRIPYSSYEDNEMQYYYDNLIDDDSFIDTYGVVTAKEVECDYVYRLASFFHQDLLYPNSFDNIRLNLLFENKDYFNAYYDFVSRFKVNSYISLVLVENDNIVEERFIERIDGKKAKSLFF